MEMVRVATKEYVRVSIDEGKGRISIIVIDRFIYFGECEEKKYIYI